MNVFQKTIEPIRDAFLSMPMTTRMIAGMLVLAIAIGLGLLVNGGTSTETEYLFGGRVLSETEVDSVEMSFSQAGLKLWEREGRRIRIPTKTRNEYLAALRESSTLPLGLRSAVQGALDKDGPFDSSEQRTARAMHAKAQDLGAKISAFPEIRWASVEYAQGERTGLSRARPQSASVVVSPEGSEPLTKARVNMVKELIRGSYAGMASEDVVVIDTNASHLSGDWENEDPMLRKRLEEEKSYEQKVLRALVGYGPIRVAAHAELDPTMGVEKATLKYDSERTTLQEYSKKIDEQSTRQGPRGVPGTAPNAIGNRAATLDEPEQSSQPKQDERETGGVVGQQYELSKLAAMQVKKVTVSVGLPTSYYDRVILQDYRREHPDKTATDMPKPTIAMLQQKRTETEGKIKAAVAPLLPPVSAGEDRLSLVHVWDFPDIPEPVVVTAGGTGKALRWLSESWTSLAMLGLAAIAILVARSALLGGGNGAPKDFNEGFGLELPVPSPEEAGESDEKDGMQITGGSLKDELFRLVDKNPEVAANVLRSWITDVAA